MKGRGLPLYDSEAGRRAEALSCAQHFAGYVGAGAQLAPRA